ncbi:MFS transporter [Natrialba taiwanensis]|uniref:Major facilitator superfamily protein n=1 Tax=Natrialba taiwanensis DSM 12281 TaxID=1230458 RepID=M0ADM5_9EURY|nr:MFS transporter [Natrialba taiwanensis]ELY96860.1 major facilitator superfamily protein [Natrialba taiwanensis DSM 12281]
MRRVSDPVGVTALVSGGHFISHVYLLVLPPLFPILAPALDTTVTDLAIGITLIYAAQFLFQIPVGEFVDRVGGKRAVVGGIALSAISIGLIGFATTGTEVLGLAFLSGIGQAAFHPGDYALLDAVGGTDAEGRRFSVHTFSGFVGFAVAPGLMTGLTAIANWHVAFISVGAGGLVYAVIFALSIAPVHRQLLAATASSAAIATDGGRFESVRMLRRPLVAGMFVFFLLVTLADTGFQTYTTALATGFDYSTALGNTALTAFLAAAACFVLVGGVLADRYDSGTIIIVSALWSALVLWIGLTMSLNSHVFVLVWSLAGAGFGLTLPARDRITNALAEGTDTGKSFGIVYTGLPIGGALAPVLLGWIIDYNGELAAFRAIALLFVAAAVLVLALRRSR